MLSKKRALKKFKKKIIRNAIVISKFSFLHTLSFFFRLFENKSYLTPHKKRTPRTLCYTKYPARKQQQPSKYWDVERYNKTTQHAFTTFIGSEINKVKKNKQLTSKQDQEKQPNKNHQTQNSLPENKKINRQNKIKHQNQHQQQKTTIKIIIEQKHAS